MCKRRSGVRRLRGRPALACMVVAGALCLWAPGASAQDVATTLEELAHLGKLEPGDAAYITGRFGERVRVTVRDVSASWLEIEVKHGEAILGESEVDHIALRDPVSNGVRWGLAGAAGAYATVCAVDAGKRGDASNCVKGLPAAGFFLGIGALVGWGVDYVIRETVYRKPESARLTISPAVAGGGAGAGITLSW